jgi:hypothetical protein
MQNKKRKSGISLYNNLVQNVAPGADPCFSTVEYHALTDGFMPKQYDRSSDLATDAKKIYFVTRR